MKTNADYIRELSDKELAIFLCEIMECENCPVHIHNLPEQRTAHQKCNLHMTCAESNLLYGLQLPQEWHNEQVNQ